MKTPRRWDRLKDFVARWYRYPLTEGDGATDEEIAGVGELGEVTARVVANGLLARDRYVTLWIENQGVWNISAPLHAGGPVLVSPEDEFGPVSASVADVLEGMLLSDTLNGAIGGEGKGALGPLKTEVTGGYVEWRDECALRIQALPALDWFQNPHFEEPYRGDDTLIVRTDPSGWMWMASDAHAFERAARLFDLARPEPHRLFVLFERLTAAESDALFGGSVDVLQAAVGDLGRLTQFGRPHAGGTLEGAIETSNPEACSSRLLERLPRKLHDRMAIAVTPRGLSVFTIVHPSSKRGERWLPKETP